ncbi:MAG TPA: HNH endonuclease [Terriglobales bacterium]|nr:HNH endonuclease [Terriglobales bacterium]
MLTLERLKELMHYDPETGLFHRLVKTSNNANMDAPAGVLDSHGYLECSIDGKRYRLHRLAVFYMTGVWPENDVDHRNTIRTDNRFENLRDVTRVVNMQNKRRPSSNNKTGFVGVYLHKQLGRFTAQIRANGKNTHLGMFDTPEQAHAAYLDAKRKLHEGNTL